MKKRGRPGGFVDRSEIFDEFLAKSGLLAETEDAALRRSPLVELRLWQTLKA